MLNKSAHSQIEMEPELLATKLHEPPRPNAVPRPHLIAHLNEGLTHPVTLLSASAGFGKTTLLSTWLNQLSAPTQVIRRSEFILMWDLIEKYRRRALDQ